MIIVPILCLLFVVAKAETPKEDSRVKSESGLAAAKGIESSFLESINPGHNGEPISGRFVYTGEDGQLYDVFYTADVYGYQAQGRLVNSRHPLANFISNFSNWSTRITLEGKYGSVVDSLDISV